MRSRNDLRKAVKREADFRRAYRDNARKAESAAGLDSIYQELKALPDDHTGLLRLTRFWQESDDFLEAAWAEREFLHTYGLRGSETADANSFLESLIKALEESQAA